MRAKDIVNIVVAANGTLGKISPAPIASYSNKDLETKDNSAIKASIRVSETKD